MNQEKENIVKIGKFVCETNHTLKEYMRKFKERRYDWGDLWDFSVEDCASGAVEPDESITYWLINNRVYEVFE